MLAILYDLQCEKKFVCQCLSTKNQTIICLLSFNGVGCDLWECNNDGANCSKSKFLGYAWLIFCVFSCVIVVIWMMERNELQTKIKGKAIEKLSMKISLLGVCCIVGFCNKWKCFFFTLVWLRWWEEWPHFDFI